MSHNKRDQFRATAEINISRAASNNLFTNRSVPDKPNKDWWAHLRRGLIIEPSAKHHKQMKQAVWLYLYFLLNADGRTGTLFRRLSTIAKDTGIQKRTVRRWLSMLKRNAYVSAEYNGNFWVILINKWRPISNYSKKNRSWLNRLKQGLFSNS